MAEFILIIFVLGYAGIVLEHAIGVNKTAVALLSAVLCWSVYFVHSPSPVAEDLTRLGHYVADVSQIIFFLMGAMALVELIDSHKGFGVITDLISTTSRRKLLWVVAWISFFLSAILDNLTTTILMVSLMRKIVPDAAQRLLLSCIVVVAANAGGAWTPIGDVTTTMLWIGGQLSPWPVIKALFIPSVVSLLVPLAYYSFQLKGRYPKSQGNIAKEMPEPGGRLVFYVGVGALISVPLFKSWTGLPPFMGILLGLALLWLITDVMHRPHTQRFHLRVPHILSKIDTPGVLFFLGILLSVNALEAVGLLGELSIWLKATVHSAPMMATLIGIFSAIVDNVPLVAASMGMYSLDSFPRDSALWHMIAYAAGTGGSLLIIGSAAGVALMGLEKVSFFTYCRKISLPAFLGFLAGMGSYLLLV